MKKFVFSFSLVITALFAEAQIVSIPDVNLKNRLLAANSTNAIATDLSGNYMDIDSNNDNQIQLSEALQVKKLDLTSSSITNLSGITSFSNLEFLDCNANQLSSVDLHGLSNLTFFCCSNNPLGTLDLSYLTALKTLLAHYCSLTSINVSGMTSLETLICTFNQISNLNLTNLPSLLSLECRVNNLQTLNVNHLTTLHAITCGNNQLSSLDVSNLALLDNLQFENNNLTSIDISNNPLIYSFDCSYNQLTSVDVSHQPNLQYSNFKGNFYTELDFSNVNGYINGDIHEYGISNSPNLATINFKNGQRDYVYFTTPNNCPNLRFICADDAEIQTMATAIQQAGVSNVQLNTYCSFVPGGNYNTITGHITIDTDNNGCDANDQYFPSIRVNINDGISPGASFTDTSGNYTFYNLSGNYTITPALPTSGYFSTSPNSAVLNFPTVNNSTQTQDFCVDPIGQRSDVDIVIIPLRVPRAGFDVTYRLVYTNKGNQVMSGSINFAFNDSIFDFVNSNPATNSQTTNNLSWNYIDLMPFESREITFTLNLNGPTETPAVNIGNFVNFTATIDPIAGDETPGDNVTSYEEIVRGSFDPNDKTCLEGNFITPEKVGDYLHYVIRFQNSGTAAAENIVVSDVIDVSKFDINSLQLTSASHPQVTRITGNKVEFFFEGIHLPAEMDNEPGSHGYIAFKIKTKNNLVLGNSVTNKANIYFDFNFPIITNTATTTVANLSNHEVENKSVSISPNPVKNLVFITAKDNITSIQLFDVQGRLISTKLNSSLNASLDLSGQQSGFYFIKVNTEKGIKVEKIIKE